jgi:hypothetical protein
MSYSLKKHIDECHRRAAEYKTLYDRASRLDEREVYFSTTLRFLRLAEDLERKRTAAVTKRAR